MTTYARHGLLGMMVALASAALLPACGDSVSSDTSASGGGVGGGGEGGAGAGGASSTATGTTSTTGSGGGATTGTTSGTGGGPPGPIGKCSDPAPAGAKAPALPKPYSGGTCPALAPGANTITSKGNARDFILVLPADYQEGEKLPVIFLWHWLGGDAEGFLEKGEIQAAADTQRFIGVLPQKKGDVLFSWPFSVQDSDARIEEELVFFDDMLACIAEKLGMNASCVASAGVSAGALFTGQLASARGEYLSSAISLSGGVGGVIKPWGNPAHKLPMIVLWGGPTDNCYGVMNFEQTSHNLEDALIEQGNFFVECIHNCGHSEPPMDAPPGQSKYGSLWGFVLDHPFWLGAGQSPYLTGGLPPSFPTWCAIGKGKATPKTGPCESGSGC